MSYIFPAMQPDGTTLYVSPLLTAAETTTLKADLARVFSNSGSSDRDAQTSAADDSTEDEAAGCGGGDAAHHQHAAPAPSVISIISVADGRMFDLQLPDDLAAIGVAAADVKLAMADKLAQPASQLRLVAINYGSHDINPKPVSDTDVVRAKALLRVLLPTAKPPRPPATPYNVVVKALTGETCAAVARACYKWHGVRHGCLSTVDVLHITVIPAVSVIIWQPAHAIIPVSMHPWAALAQAHSV